MTAHGNMTAQVTIDGPGDHGGPRNHGGARGPWRRTQEVGSLGTTPGVRAPGRGCCRRAAMVWAAVVSAAVVPVCRRGRRGPPCPRCPQGPLEPCGSRILVDIVVDPG